MIPGQTPDLIEMSRNALIWLVANPRVYIKVCGIIGVILLADSVYQSAKILHSPQRENGDM
jgi:hypothetical protein